MADEFEKGLGGLETGPETSGGVGPEPSFETEVEHPSVAALREEFGDAILRHELHAGDEHVIYIEASRNRGILRWLRDAPDQRYDFLADVTGVDYGGGRPIQVVYQLWSIPHKRALRVKVELPLRSLEVDSVVPVWSTANWLEREVYDLFGVEFIGHPDLRRIMMPENYAEGHPLRKDFPLRGRFSRAEQTRRALSYDLEVFYTPQELEILKDRDWERAQQRAKAQQADRGDFPDDREDSRDPRDEGVEAEVAEEQE
ncbi:MAG: NADH-quinone oxidoreductase subunit C [Longimicrobiales bacterium]|nr:NADH-quinone oxidoreductase subunit C [Longimicrobiales bacterium]